MFQKIQFVPYIMILSTIVLFIVAGVASSIVVDKNDRKSGDHFRFSNLYTDNMVLQSAPKKAQIWGFSMHLNDEIIVTFQNTNISATVTKTIDGRFIWSAFLPPTPSSLQEYQIHVFDGRSEINVQNILFGDVWICSGQSNMAYSLNGSNGVALVHPPVNNSLHEIQDMINYPHMRLYRGGQIAGVTSEQLELPRPTSGGSKEVTIGWSKPCPSGDFNSCRSDFSSMCYFFGRNLQATLKLKTGKILPIGLIGTYYGGTADELWSSKDALSECLDPQKPVPKIDSTLWNAMIFPILKMTIKGAIWYQGEADSKHPGGIYDGYNCTFPAMISDWRRKWHTHTNGETDQNFPFGFVQLDSIGNDTIFNNPKDPEDDAFSPQFGYAGLRWAQTAGYGSVPNPVQKNVYMAISYDTPDRPYKFISKLNGRGDIGFNVHSPFKQYPAARLCRSIVSGVYGIDVDTSGPLFDRVLKKTSNETIIQIKNVGSMGGIIRHNYSKGFEILNEKDMKWYNAVIAYTTTDTITIKYDVTDISNGIKLRYNWYSNPCGIYCFECAIYVKVKPLGFLTGMKDFLPLAPFIVDL